MFKRIPHEDESITGDDSVESYNAKQKKMANTFKPIIKIITNMGIKGKALEVGTGPAYFTTLIAEKNPELQITGLELSEDMIKAANKNIEEKGLSEKIKMISGNIDDIEVLKKLDKYDLIYSTFSLHHWTNPDIIIENLLKLLNKDGILLLIDLVRVPILYFIKSNNGFIKSVKAAYTKQEIINMFNLLGIKNFKVKKFFPWIWMSILVKQF